MKTTYYLMRNSSIEEKYQWFNITEASMHIFRSRDNHNNNNNHYNHNNNYHDYNITRNPETN